MELPPSPGVDELLMSLSFTKKKEKKKERNFRSGSSECKQTEALRAEGRKEEGGGMERERVRWEGGGGGATLHHPHSNTHTRLHKEAGEEREAL